MKKLIRRMLRGIIKSAVLELVSTFQEERVRTRILSGFEITRLLDLKLNDPMMTRAIEAKKKLYDHCLKNIKKYVESGEIFKLT